MNNDILINSMDILLRKLNSQQIINNTFEARTMKCLHSKYMFNNIPKTQFINEGFAIFKERSEDEIENILMHISEKISRKTGIFQLIAELSKELLCIEGQDILCYKEKLLDWRMIYSRVGQDVLTTLSIAVNDIKEGKETREFNWKPVIDIKGIKNDKEIAENHFHLKGSAPTFTLSWVSLMNDITGRSKQFDETKIDVKRLDPDLNFSIDKKNISIYILLKKAAIIRAFLFSWINNRSFFSNEKIWKEQEEWAQLNMYLKNDKLLDIKSYCIQEKINRLKFIFGKRFEERRIIDYAIKRISSDPISKEAKINTNDVLCGERYILYMMFKKIFDEDKDEKINSYINLFYSYIVMKLRFRSELIQVNKRVGFKNFSDYQDRKSCFIKHDKLLMSLMHNTAINQTLDNQPQIKYLEARIAPENSNVKLYKAIYEIDNDVKKYKHDIKLVCLKRLKLEYKNFDLDKYFYVIHFIKGKDKTKYKSNMNKLIYSFLPRDYKKRNEIKKQTLVIESLRQEYDLIKKRNNLVKLNKNIYHPSKRILGIDGCANEIGCRPEVFAQAFRYLRKKKNNNNTLNKMILGATYHVGEDFLDIVDGLRAIDEAIEYLCLGEHDRLGHALALGININEWYTYKFRTVILNKQDLLDNIVWLLNKCEEFNLDKSFNDHFKYKDLVNLKELLNKKFNELFKEIYGKGLSYKNSNYTELNWKDYHNSWLLRGNDPYSYFTNIYNNKMPNSWNDYGVIEIGLLGEDKLKADCLFYNYHFNLDVKKAGKGMSTYCIIREYEEFVKIVQKNMILEIQKKKVYIESNPSSNYLIGTITRYDEHPIIRFYDLKNIDEESFVSINTDDQGIFNTNLTNEYAIMEVALENKYNLKNEYNLDDIQIWINNIKDASIRQSFAQSVSHD